MSDYSIALFPAAGFLFGLLSYSRRHLFGEGPPDQHVDPVDGFGGRVYWVAVCTFLWPILIVSGLHGLWRVRAAARRR